MSDPVTMATITDEQIRDLRAAGLISQAVFEFATYPCWYNRDYRYRCAKIFNERAAPSVPADAREAGVFTPHEDLR